MTLPICRWKLEKAFYSKESLATKGCLEILHDIFCPLWTCLKRKQKQQSCHKERRGNYESLKDDPANERSLNLADLGNLDPEYISNMTIHSWKKKGDSDSDDDLLTMSPTTIERLDRDPTTIERLDRDPTTTERLDRDPTTIERLDRDPTTIERLDRDPTTIERLDRDPSTVDQSPDDPFKDKLSPQDIELSDAMATSAAAISRYDNNFEVLRLSTILGLEMGATVISNFEEIKKEGCLMKVRGCPTRDQITFILQ